MALFCQSHFNKSLEEKSWVLQALNDGGSVIGEMQTQRTLNSPNSSSEAKLSLLFILGEAWMCIGHQHLGIISRKRRHSAHSTAAICSAQYYASDHHQTSCCLITEKYEACLEYLKTETLLTRSHDSLWGAVDTACFFT